MSKSRRKREGVVYSTSDSYEYRYGKPQEPALLPPQQQRLRVQLDKKSRRGKAVTLVTGFEGPEADLKDLGKRLKAACGGGGSTKDGEIMVQGDHRDKVVAWLLDKGYRQTKKSGG